VRQQIVEVEVALGNHPILIDVMACNFRTVFLNYGHSTFLRRLRRRQSPNGVTVRLAGQLLLSSLHEWQLERLAGCLAHLLILIFVVG
jgi:hypothetical protein